MNISPATTAPMSHAAPPPRPPAQAVDKDGDHDNNAPDVKPAGGNGSKLNIKA